jgi:hypothetical protein
MVMEILEQPEEVVEVLLREAQEEVFEALMALWD